MLIATIIALLLLTMYYSWTSRLNQFFFFGRTVPEGFASSAEARSIARRYLLNIWLGCAAAMLVCAVLWRQHIHSCYLWSFVALALAFNVAFARAHGETGRLAPEAAPQTVVEVPLTTPAVRVPSLAMLLAPMLFAAAVLAVSLVAAAGGRSLKQSPQALDALVAAHGSESMFSFGLGLVVAGFLALLIRLRARTRTPLAGTALRSSMIATWAGALVMTLAIVLAFAGGTVPHAASKAVILAGVVAALAVILFRIITSRRFAPPAAEIQADENWRWGLFYCNRNDPALFVQCRCGVVGYTLNYGRLMAWPLSVAYVGLVVTMLVIAGYK